MSVSMVTTTGQEQPVPHGPHVPLCHQDEGVWDAGVSSPVLSRPSLTSVIHVIGN